MASVVKEEPRFEDVPPQVRRLLKSCLEKDPKKRLRDIGDAWRLLEDAPKSAPFGHGSDWWMLAAAVFAVALAALAFVHFRETPPEAAAMRTTILAPDNTTLDFTNGLGLPAISHDGRRMVFGARTADGKAPLWVRSLDAPTAQPLAGADPRSRWRMLRGLAAEAGTRLASSFSTPAGASTACPHPAGQPRQ